MPNSDHERDVQQLLVSDRGHGSLVATVALALDRVPWDHRRATARQALEALHADGWEITRTKVERYDPEDTW